MARIDDDSEAGGETPSPDELKQVLYAAEDARQKAANLSATQPDTDTRSLLEKFLDKYQMPEAAAARHAEKDAAAPAPVKLAPPSPSKGVPELLAAPPAPAASAAAVAPKPKPSIQMVPDTTSVPVTTPVSSPAAPTTASEYLADPGRVAFLAQRARELGLAQDQANKNQRMADLANAGVKVSAALEGKDAPKELLDANVQRAQLPVAQALQRQAAADAASKDYSAQQESDIKGNEQRNLLDSQRPGSPISQRGYMLAVALKLIPASYPANEFTESMRQQLMAGATIQQAREASQAQLAEAKARLGFDMQKETRESRQGDARLQIEGARAAQEMGQKGRIPEQEGSKLAAAQPALDALDRLEEQYKKTGPLSPNENSKYEMMKSALAPIIVAGVAPSARETENLMDGFKKNAPGVLTRDSNGHVFFDEQRRSVHDNNANQVKLIKAGNYNPAQIEALGLRPDAHAAAPGGAAPSSAAPKKAITRTDPATGETRTWNGSAWVK